MIEQVEGLLKGEGLSERAEVAIEKLLNVVEALCADKKALADEVERLRKELKQKKKKQLKRSKRNCKKWRRKMQNKKDSTKKNLIVLCWHKPN